LFALLIALRVGNTVSPFISPDDYHFGETVIGWWSYLHGVLPYVGYLPPHGVIPDDLSSFLSFVFYDGTAGSFADASRLSYALLGLLAFISVFRFSGSIGLAFVSIYFVGGNSAWLFFTPFLCLWFSRSLIDNPARWLSIWTLTIPIVFLGVPGQGLLLVAASAVMAAYITWNFWRDPEKRSWRDIGLSLALLIAVAFSTPLIPMLSGAIRYVAENGPINQVAYGISWANSWGQSRMAGLVFEVVRMSWVVIPITCMAIIYAGMKNLADRKNTVLPAVVVFLLVLLLIPYSMGRIDAGVISRPGLVAILAWTILFPIVVWGTLKPAHRAALILLVAAMGATMNFIPPRFFHLVAAASAQVDAGSLKDGAGAGLPNIGMAAVRKEHWDRLTRLKGLLNSKLAADESYLDLTSRNAQYFYLNRKPMMAVTAPYNMAPPSQQKRAVEQLSKNLPRVVLLDGANITHDGGGLALRDHYLYRFILDRYIPKFENGFIFGYRKTDGVDNHEPTIDAAIRNLTDVNWEHGINRREPAVIVDDARLLPLLTIGAEVRIDAGEIRRITRVWNEGSTIWLDGSVIDPAIAANPHQIQIVVTPEIEAEYRVSLFEKAFAQSDFKKIPVAWGRSEKSLAGKMSLITGLGGLAPSIHDLVSENGSYKVTGVDPWLSFDMSSSDLAGRDAGLLKFNFSCINRSAEPRVRVFWWGDNHEAPFELSSIRFTADDGTLIVPLDASPRWMATKHLKGIRIALDNTSACGAFSVGNISLFQRRV
jgi:hypothetical protein